MNHTDNAAATAIANVRAAIGGFKRRLDTMAFLKDIGYSVVECDLDEDGIVYQWHNADLNLMQQGVCGRERDCWDEALADAHSRHYGYHGNRAAAGASHFITAAFLRRVLSNRDAAPAFKHEYECFATLDATEVMPAGGMKATSEGPFQHMLDRNVVVPIIVAITCIEADALFPYDDAGHPLPLAADQRALVASLVSMIAKVAPVDPADIEVAVPRVKEASQMTVDGQLCALAGTVSWSGHCVQFAYSLR